MPSLTHEEMKHRDHSELDDAGVWGHPGSRLHVLTQNSLLQIT
jgi:hypothetical protein